jgi:hypothetical protein
MAFKLSNATLRDYIESLNHQVPSATVRLLGIKGAVPYDGDASHTSVSLTDDTLDHWNDTIGIWGGDWALYTGTVDPGLYYTQHPENANGAAHLVPLEHPKGKPWRLKWGIHKGQYEALVQDEDFKVQRDKNKNGRPDAGEPVDTGQFGIHIHWGGQNWSVGKWSAGCQVMFGGDHPDSPWRLFKAALKATGQDTFEYFLIDGHALARHLGLIT